MLYNLQFNMLYNTCYITFEELLYDIEVWLYNIQGGYITHPNLPDADVDWQASLPTAFALH